LTRYSVTVDDQKYIASPETAVLVAYGKRRDWLLKAADLGAVCCFVDQRR